ncbi:laminin subunit gamma-1-like [Ptychodera flava]|uniref:laminin subunit gamma-1-like n=1 Tax=Ptychodera flava TaxID=63121 RepID=UPI00396A0994
MAATWTMAGGGTSRSQLLEKVTFPGILSLARLSLFMLLIQCTIAQHMSRSACYDQQGRPQRCIAEFVNAAYNVTIKSTNTCGLRRVSGRPDYCLQTGVTGATKSCHVCDAYDDKLKHPPEYMTDFHNDIDSTWWQSETMLQDIQYPNMVNLTLPLGKSFEVTYVRLKFHTSRPESFAIYKRTSKDGQWIPWQYYSGSCRRIYGVENRGVVTIQDETKALCTDEFSDISPLTGGNVAFSTLESRPSAYDFDNSPVLQDWVTATDIMVTLNRLNTFGDEVFRDPNVLRSYYYAISDFAVGGRCKCNGHASECIVKKDGNNEEELVCDCQHNTAGPDCNECLPFYNNVPWQVATATDAHECKACDCNGLSDRCYFDQELYDRTGNGGHCEDCRLNTDGPNCERCRNDFYRTDPTAFCQPCYCNKTGSQTTQCDVTGTCICKPGVTGQKCDRCKEDFYDFSVTGCRPCACLEAGSINNDPTCESDNGVCACKENVEGINCDRCKPGHFNLQADDSLGCTACFCFGHASICTSASGFVEDAIEHQFDRGNSGWTGEGSRGEEVPISWTIFTGAIGLQAPDIYPYFFVAPDDFLGDQKFSYGQELSFSFRVGNDDEIRLSSQDIIIEGSGFTISAPLTAQGNPQPNTVIQEYVFKLHEHPSYGWSPSLSAYTFQRLLADVTSVKIRGSYQDQGVGFLDDVKLVTATRSVGGENQVDSVELCQCPEGYAGQFCESCAPGFRRENPDIGEYSRCIPCECNGHSSACDVNTGACLCEHNTEGDNCERCKVGFYGNAQDGTPDDCKPCPCPGQRACIEIGDDVVCTDCEPGHSGSRCELCSDGFYGDPQGLYGPPRPCQACLCNGNTDPNAVGNCNSTTGECLKCIFNTGGYNCQECLPGFYGDALAEPKGQCKACECHTEGSRGIECHPVSGQCDCQPFVIGRNCTECEPGYWNLDSGNGCTECNCNFIGSLNGECEVSNGHCICQPGVTGEKCDECLPNYYGFSETGCTACNCDPQGSLSLQCNADGECLCKPGVIGIKCDMCEENKYNLALGCIPCPACYDLVQDAVDEHRKKLKELRDLIDNIGSNPEAINDEQFEKRMKEVNDTINDLLHDAMMAAGNESALLDHLNDIRDSIDGLKDQLEQISNNVDDASNSIDDGKDDIGDAEEAIKRAQDLLDDAYDHVEDKGQDALKEAEEAASDLGDQAEEMAALAKKAEEEAEKQTAEAAEIEGISDEALNTSKEALKLAQDALGDQGGVSDRIKDLEDKFSEAEALAKQAMMLAQAAQEKAIDLLDEATAILADANSPLPVIDVEPLKGNASDIMDEAKRIKALAEKLIQENRDLLEEVQENSEEAGDLLDEGREAQQAADLLLARVNYAEAIAEAAINQGDKTLREAKEMLETLKGFNQLVENSKGAAEDALTDIPEIERIIEEATDTADEANEAIEGAETDAIDARDIATEAEDIAKDASDGAGQVKDDAENTLTDAQGLSDEAKQLMMDVDQTQEELDGLARQAIDDAELASEALMKANEASRDADGASKAVDQALQDVDELLDELANLDPLDLDKLAELEQDFVDANATLQGADIDGKLDELREAKGQQDMWIKEYEDALEELRKAVQNVRDINDALPEGCYRQQKIENPP